MVSKLHNARRSLFEEIEKRKTAEKTLKLMRSQWERIHNLMSQDGLIFHAPPASCDVMQLEKNFIDQFTQEVFVTRFVAEAVGRGLGRAEDEETAAVVIESKDQEIARLRDRLQYYEPVNHEMSQRKLVGKLSGLVLCVIGKDISFAALFGNPLESIFPCASRC